MLDAGVGGHLVQAATGCKIADFQGMRNSLFDYRLRDWSSPRPRKLLGFVNFLPNRPKNLRILLTSSTPRLIVLAIFLHCLSLGGKSSRNKRTSQQAVNIDSSVPQLHVPAGDGRLGSNGPLPVRGAALIRSGFLPSSGHVNQGLPDS